MKKLLWMLPLAFIASCVTIPKPQHYTIVGHVDYRPYSEKGFFITESNSVNFDYTPVSTIVIKSVPGYLPEGRKPKIDPRSNNDMYSVPGQEDIKPNDDGHISVTVKSVLDMLYQKAVEAGANGIINLEVRVSDGGYIASGMAIKR